MALANTIRQLRFRQGEMTQKKLAEYVGVSRQTINAIEGGKYSPSLEVAFRIADILCTSIEDVFLYEPDFESVEEYADGVVVNVIVQVDDPGIGN